MMKRLKLGLWNGIPPYGYRLVDKKLVIEPTEAELVRRIFDWFMKRNMGVVAISRELNGREIKPRKGARWKGTRIHKMIGNSLYAGMIRWGGETAMGTHEPIISKELFEAAQDTMHGRNHKTRQLRSPNYLSGLVKCGLCGAPMHVTYPGVEPKSRFKYYVCNNRYNHRSCKQDYIRADILEESVIREIGKLADRKDVISVLVNEYAANNREALPKLEEKRKAILHDLAALGAERQKLSRWLLRTQPTDQAVNFVNTQIEGVSEKETRLQEKQWAIEDQINDLQKQTYDAETISGQLKGFVANFPGLDQGERKLLVESLVEQVEIGKNKRVAASLRPPFAFGFMSPELAPRAR
jgi:site-specific DNA recombinase